MGFRQRRLYHCKGLWSTAGTNGFGQFRVQGDKLIAIGSDHGKIQLEVYTKSGGIFSLSQAIELPMSNSGYANYEWNLAVGTGFIVVGSEQFEHADRSNGIPLSVKKMAHTVQPQCYSRLLTKHLHHGGHSGTASST